VQDQTHGDVPRPTAIFSLESEATFSMQSYEATARAVEGSPQQCRDVCINRPNRSSLPHVDMLQEASGASKTSCSWIMQRITTILRCHCSTSVSRSIAVNDSASADDVAWENATVWEHGGVTVRDPPVSVVVSTRTAPTQYQVRIRLHVLFLTPFYYQFESAAASHKCGAVRFFIQADLTDQINLDARQFTISCGA
jgi:hypothetical protein